MAYVDTCYRYTTTDYSIYIPKSMDIRADTLQGKASMLPIIKINDYVRWNTNWSVMPDGESAIHRDHRHFVSKTAIVD